MLSELSKSWFEKPADAYSPEDGFHLSKDKDKGKSKAKLSEGDQTLLEEDSPGVVREQSIIEDTPEEDNPIPEVPVADVALESDLVVTEALDDAAAPNKLDDDNYEDILVPARRSRRQNKTREVSKNNARAKNIEKNGV